ncbi:bZIP transcription factor 11-like [Solanum dulcamara]|uniref:bZIP transcription factor 11-like n=1 Tax=Solanum dulcamara TaxID=45834 RepID=UPI002485CBF7|nr:bZIP transcription factor 11-like [Solanum dulcamara]
MAGTSSVSLRKYGCEDERKRKRMISNRESARRSRMKKHKYLDELLAQVDLLKEQNNQIVTNINMVNQLYLNMEAENSVLKAQVVELSHRLHCVEEIINCMNSTNDEDLWNYNVNGGDDFLKTWDFAPWETTTYLV